MLTLLKTPLALAATLAALTLGGAPAHAQSFTFSFSPVTGTAAPGGTASYTGIFDNQTATDYFITGATFTSADPNSGGLQGFFNGDPANGDPATGAFEVFSHTTQTVGSVFQLALDPSLPAATYNGTVTFVGQTASDFQGGSGSDAALGDAALTLHAAGGAAPVPEASSVVSLGLMLAAGAVLVLRRRRSAS